MQNRAFHTMCSDGLSFMFQAVYIILSAVLRSSCVEKLGVLIPFQSKMDFEVLALVSQPLCVDCLKTHRGEVMEAGFIGIERADFF